MTRGFYSATAAMISDMERFESVANNLANVNTTGYKRQQTVHQDFERGFLERIQGTRQQMHLDDNGQLQRELVSASPQQIGRLGTGTYVSESYTHFDQGNLQHTENPLDLALKGEGFFALSGPNGEQQYTRNGHFTLNSEGQLANSEGWLVQGQGGGAIRLDGTAKMTIDTQGQILVDGQVVDRLRQVRFEQPQLLNNEGSNRYSAPEPLPALEAQAEVAQGYVEGSNVDVASEMVQMISALRSYQISQKALQTEDEMSGRLINDVAKV